MFTVIDLKEWEWKTCTRCGIAYERTDEHWRRRTQSADSLESWCRHCHYEYMTAWLKKNPDYKSRSRCRPVEEPSTCHYCGVELVTGLGKCWHSCKEYATVEHLVPVAQGGSNTPDNLVWACWECNSSKGALSVEEFLS